MNLELPSSLKPSHLLYTQSVNTQHFNWSAREKWGCQNSRRILSFWESGLKSTVRLQWTKGHDPPETKTCCGSEGKGVGQCVRAAEAGEPVTLYAIYLMLYSCQSKLCFSRYSGLSLHCFQWLVRINILHICAVLFK